MYWCIYFVYALFIQYLYFHNSALMHQDIVLFIYGLLSEKAQQATLCDSYGLAKMASGWLEKKNMFFTQQHGLTFLKAYL